MENWEQLLVPAEMTVRDAIIKLDKAGQRMIVVVDDKRHLLGTVTDGDIRRALIRQVEMSSSIAEIMCKDPRFATLNWSPEQIQLEMEALDILLLPVVDHEKRLIDVKKLRDMLKKPSHNNPVLLIAGGFGKRLAPLTENCPKPMLKVGEKPILELIVERFIKKGFHKFYISTHYLHDMIFSHLRDGSQWGVSINYLREESPLGTGGALGLLSQNSIDLPLIMMNADLLTTIDFESLLLFHEAHGGNATMCGRKYEQLVPYGVIQSEGHRVISIEEKPIQRFFINAGIYVLDPKLIYSIVPGEYIDMPSVIAKEISAGRHVNLFPVHEYWLDIGRMEDYSLAQQEVISYEYA